MKAKAGDVIECLSCKKPVGTILADVPNHNMVLGEHLSIPAKSYGERGPICDILQIRGKRVG
jgi:hypothetical protein